MTRKTLNIAIAAALFGSLALVGCKKKQDDAAMTPPPATTEPATTPAPAPAPAPAPPLPPHRSVRSTWAMPSAPT